MAAVGPGHAKPASEHGGQAHSCRIPRASEEELLHGDSRHIAEHFSGGQPRAAQPLLGSHLVAALRPTASLSSMLCKYPAL